MDCFNICLTYEDPDAEPQIGQSAIVSTCKSIPANIDYIEIELFQDRIEAMLRCSDGKFYHQTVPFDMTRIFESMLNARQEQLPGEK